MSKRILFAILTGALILSPRLAHSELRVNLSIKPGADVAVYPVTTGVPFAKGTVKQTAELKLLGPDGAVVPLQKRLLSVWPDGSVRWALLDFQAESSAAEGDWILTTNGGAAPGTSTQLKINETDEAIRVDTGVLRIAVSKRRLSGIEEAAVDGRQIISAGHGGGLVLDVGSGRHDLSMLRPDEVIIEEAGPLRAVIRAKGHTEQDGVRIDFIFRLHAYAGIPWIRLDHTFTNPTDKVIRLNELAIELPLATSVERYAVGADGEAAIEGALETEMALVQSPDHEMQNYEGHVFRVQEGDRGAGGGSRARGWLQVSGSSASITVAVRDFWQLYPKGFRADSKRIAIDLWPKGALPQPAGHMDVNLGAARTHEMILAFDGPMSRVGGNDLAQLLEEPPMAFASPDYYASTKAVANGELAPAVINGKTVHPDYEAFVEWMMQECFLKRRHEQDEYGMMHFGDYLLGNRIWNCLQYELPRSFTQQFFRTGDRRFFDWAGEMVRGQRDLMVLWHEDVARGHRAQRSYGGEWRNGEPHGKTSGGSAMLHVGGMADYYLLTGDWRTREALLWMADGLANVRQNLTWFQPRGMGWRAGGYPLKVMAEAYKLTGDERYREQAIRILEQEVYPYAHTADNGFDLPLADGVWWVEDEDAGGWRNQAWMVDQMGDALYSVYTILDDGPVKERTRKALLDVADWVIDYAWKPEPGGLAVQYTKTKEGAYTAHQTYDGFIVMLAVSTSARAYALTGEQKYLDTARALFQTSVKTGRKAVNEGKQVGQVMQYAPIYMAIEADSSEAVENGK